MPLCKIQAYGSEQHCFVEMVLTDKEYEIVSKVFKTYMSEREAQDDMGLSPELFITNLDEEKKLLKKREKEEKKNINDQPLIIPYERVNGKMVAAYNKHPKFKYRK